MDMNWLHSKRENSPSLLFALCFKKLLATMLQLASENWLSSLGTPDEMIDNEMDSVFLSLVFKFTLFCRFHSRQSTANSTDCQQQWQVLTPARNPPIRLG